MTMTGKPLTPRQRAFFLLGLGHARSRRHRAELREMEDRLDDRLSEHEEGSEAATAGDEPDDFDS
jgi:hypothetical protein